MPVIPDVLYRTFEQSPEILEGLKTGIYDICGGVIRVTKGNDKAGTIVAHLKFPGKAQQAAESIEKLKSSLSNIHGGIATLQNSLGTLQNLQYANIALSGLNLAVSAAGFAIVCKKLNGIESILITHTQKLDTLLSLALDAQEKASFQQTARFNAVITTARQFVEMNDYEQLKTLIRPFNEQYEFTSLILKNCARSANNPDFFTSLPELFLLQERFMHLGMCLSYIQQKIEAPIYAIETMQKMQSDWLEINQTIVEILTSSPETINALTQQNAGSIRSFLNYRKERISGIEYQTNLLILVQKRPELTKVINAESDDILLLAA
ncbi:hypothetical protein ACF2G4_01050 [Pantoea sp. C3]|uniref:hypothetical protein n=1 Tax=Pantoea phytostimulans TaxID=2769024 RepID=UPI0038F7A57D